MAFGQGPNLFFDPCLGASPHSMQESHPALSYVRPILWGAMSPLRVFPWMRSESKRQGLRQGAGRQVQLWASHCKGPASSISTVRPGPQPPRVPVIPQAGPALTRAPGLCLADFWAQVPLKALEGSTWAPCLETLSPPAPRRAPHCTGDQFQHLPRWGPLAGWSHQLPFQVPRGHLPGMQEGGIHKCEVKE